MEELQRSSEAGEVVEDKQKKPEMDSDKNTVKNRKKKKAKSNDSNTRRKYYAVPKFACFRSDYDVPTVERSERGEGRSFDMESASAPGEDRAPPTHLVVMVNGIMGSAQNWRFAAKQFLKKYPRDVIVHCSECNSAMLTLDGFDVMGKRLADEVMSVIKRYPDLQKISFIGHSLGGLIARYAVAKLYEQEIEMEDSQENGECRLDGSKDPCLKAKVKGRIAGLEPMNFITCATPHLGSRGHKQVPMFCGFYTLEKIALRSSWFLRRTGKHLFLTDTNDGKSPLLLQMANDCEDLRYISALQSFKRCVAYANACFDHIVGWSTSSLRRRNELPKRKHLSRNDKYPHIVNVEMAKTASSEQKVSLEAQVNGHKTDDLEETMIRGLTKVSWERVDVSFSRSKQRFFAHTTIQVKTLCINSDGADVIQHIVDNFLL